MRIELVWVGVAWFSSLACGGAVPEDSQARCEDTTAQIDQALRNYIDAGYLVPEAMPCELTLQSVDSRVPAESVQQLLGQFRAACELQVACCSGACPPAPVSDDSLPQRVPPPSIPPPYITAAKSASSAPR